jgi:hypothetical protein
MDRASASSVISSEGWSGSLTHNGCFFKKERRVVDFQLMGGEEVVEGACDKESSSFSVSYSLVVREAVLVASSIWRNTPAVNLMLVARRFFDLLVSRLGNRRAKHDGTFILVVVAFSKVDSSLRFKRNVVGLELWVFATSIYIISRSRWVRAYRLGRPPTNRQERRHRTSLP